MTQIVGATPEQDQTLAQVAAAVQAGNAAELMKKFNAMVDLTLPGFDDSYSRVQAGQMLKDFFAQNPVKSFTITKSGSSPDGSRYHIGTLETSKKTYRVYFIVKSAGGQDLIHQFQVQEN
ncbi:MAG TPA: DUF4783 domain-containing protein [Bacteroidales bacterium]|nr:DUF4783 domain-containing protein [Bacteroidales bacterium]